MLLVLVGLGFFFKYMVDNDWIGPWGRVGLGALAGFVFLGLGELMARKGKLQPIFVQSVVGLGLAALMVSTYASFAFYHLVPVPWAFAIIALLATFGGALAIHHKAETILVVALVAVFLNPILLSTGSDRVLALLAYLLLMCGAALWVAVRMRFRVGLWVSVVGGMAIAAGWYVSHFDASPPVALPGVDTLPEDLEGAYYPLLQRVVPLAFVTLYAAQLVAAALFYRRRHGKALPLLAQLVAAVFAHVGVAALLYDHGLLLAGVLILLGVAFGGLLVRNEQEGWLALPLLCSLAILIPLRDDALPAAELMALVGLGVLWASVYFVAVLRRALQTAGLERTGPQVLLGLPGLSLVGMLTGWVLADRPLLLAVLVVLLAAGYLALSVAARSAPMLLLTFLVSLGALVATATEVARPSYSFLGLAIVWTGLHLGALAVDLFVRGVPWSRARLAVLAGAGTSFAALVFITTPASAGVLRAGLSVTMGVVYLALSLRMRAPTEVARHARLLTLGIALICFTWAVGMLFEGTPLTVLWIVEAIVILYIAQRGSEPVWLVWGLLLLALSCGRVVFLDLLWLPRQEELFLTSLGAEGSVVPTAFLHRRAWSLAALGIGALLGGRFVARGRRPGFPEAALGLAILGYLALLGLAVGETRILFCSYPTPPPTGLARAEFLALLDQFHAALDAQATKLHVVMTLTLGAYAAGLVAVGFLTRRRLERVGGILLFAATVGKLALYDVWSLERVQQIIILVVIGLLLLAGGFLYARFGRAILREILDDGQKALWVLLLAGLGLLAPRAAEARVGPEAFEWVRAIDGIDAPGDYRVILDPAAYGQSQSNPLFHDLRVFGPGGDERPWVVRPAGSSAPAERAGVDPTVPIAAGMGVIRLELLGTAKSEPGKTVVELDALPPRLPLRSVLLKLPATPFSRQATVECTTQRQAWFRAGGARIEHIPGRERSSGRPPWVRIPIDPGEHRLLRVRIEDGDDPPLELHAAAAEYTLQEFVVRTARPGSHDLLLGSPSAPAPHYDLARLLQRGGAAGLREASLGPARANPKRAVAAPSPATEPPWTERHAGLLRAGLLVLAGALGIWTLLLLRRNRR